VADGAPRRSEQQAADGQPLSPQPPGSDAGGGGGGGSGHASAESAREGGDAAESGNATQAPPSLHQAAAVASPRTPQPEQQEQGAAGTGASSLPPQQQQVGASTPVHRGKAVRRRAQAAAALEPGLLLVRPRGEGSEGEASDWDGEDGEEEEEEEEGGRGQQAGQPKKDGLLKQARAAAGRLLRGRRTVQLPAGEAAAAARGTAAAVGMAVAGTPGAAAGGAAGAGAGTPALGQLGRGSGPTRSAGGRQAAGADAEELEDCEGVPAQALVLLEGFELFAAEMVRCPPAGAATPHVAASAAPAPSRRRPQPLGLLGEQGGGFGVAGARTLRRQRLQVQRQVGSCPQIRLQANSNQPSLRLGKVFLATAVPLAPTRSAPTITFPNPHLANPSPRPHPTPGRRLE
jgi:hypothetical protein